MERAAVYNDDWKRNFTHTHNPCVFVSVFVFVALCISTMTVRERFKKKIEKKLTNVSFAFTHTYTPVKTNIFRFFPQSYMENFEKCAKTQKRKNNMLSHVTCGC